MSTKHTPGPWEARMGEFDFGNDGSRRVMAGERDKASYRRIGTVDPQAERKERGKNKTAYNAPDAERDANARLIAAAPELLDALAAIVNHGEPIYPSDWQRLKTNGLDAIAKATKHS